MFFSAFYATKRLLLASVLWRLRGHLHAAVRLVALRSRTGRHTLLDFLVLLDKRAACTPVGRAAVARAIALDAEPLTDLAALKHCIDPATAGEVHHPTHDQAIGVDCLIRGHGRIANALGGLAEEDTWAAAAHEAGLSWATVEQRVRPLLLVYILTRSILRLYHLALRCVVLMHLRLRLLLVRLILLHLILRYVLVILRHLLLELRLLLLLRVTMLWRRIGLLSSGGWGLVSHLGRLD